jgi:hypothetical protein
MEEFHKKWSQTVKAILEDYHLTHPNDIRGDLGLIENLFDFWYQKGLIEKSPNGKYLLPNIEGTIPLIN